MVIPMKETKLDVCKNTHTHNTQIVICTKLFSFKKPAFNLDFELLQYKFSKINSIFLFVSLV